MPFDNPYQLPIGDLEILTDARARIDSENSWVQGRFRDGDRHCLVAALSLACGSRSFNAPNRTERRLARLLVKQLPPDTPFWAWIRFAPARQRLMAFNDDPQTSHGDVVGLLDQTISVRRAGRQLPSQRDRVGRLRAETEPSVIGEVQCE